MFYTESEYRDYIQKTRISRTAGKFFPILIVIGAFTIGLSFDLTSHHIFSYISIFWYICGIGLLVYFVIRYSLKTKIQNFYSIMSPGEWLWKTSIPVKFWIKNDQIITFDLQKAHLQSEFSDTNEMVFFSLLLDFTLVEIPYFVLVSAYSLFQKYDASIILSLNEITIGMLLLLFFGQSILLPIIIRLIGRRFIQWTITKHSIADVDLNYKNLDAKHFRTFLPVTSIISSSILEYPVKDLFNKSRIGRFFMKRMDKTLLNSMIYALVISMPLSIGSKRDVENTGQYSTSDFILLRNRNKEVVEDFQKVLHAWVQS